MTAPEHPGTILRRDFIDPQGWSIRRLAKAAGIRKTDVIRIAAKMQPIETDTARGLAGALGTTAEFWVNLQARYDEARR
jgi:addiction module HigA family antidote